MKVGIIWCIKDDSAISFWDDDWVRNVSHLLFFYQGQGEPNLTIRVKDVTLADGS